MVVAAGTGRIDAASVELIESSHAVKLCASADARHFATGAHAFASRVTPDRRVVITMLARSQSPGLLRCIEATGRIALTACHIKSYRTVQLKGEDARLFEPDDADRAATIAFSTDSSAACSLRSRSHSAACLRK